ncbi:MAG: ABC transporter permease subunit [bacterium]
MLFTLIRKELLDNFLSFRFVVSSIIVVLIMTLSVGILMQDYTSRRDSYNQNQNAYYDAAKSLDNYLELMFTGIGADRPPSELQFLYTGTEKNPNRSTVIYPFYKPSFQGELNFNPVFPLFPAVDLLFVVSIVLSLIAFVYSYDAVCGERESGTLKLLMSYSIPRDKIILAKWFGGYISLIIPYVFGIILCSLFMVVNTSVNLTGQAWAAFFLTTLVSLLFIAVMYSVGLFVSVRSKLSSTSISVLLFIWVIFVLVVPNAAPFVVDKIQPAPTPSQVMSRIKFKSGNAINGLLEDMIKMFEDATGFNINQIDFGGQGGDKKKEDSGQQETKQQEQTQQQTASASGGGDSGATAAKAPAGLDLRALESLSGEITDADLRDLQLKGCSNWVDKKLKEKFGMTMDQAKKMIKDYGVDVDVNEIMKQCESKKKELIALKKSGASNADIAAQAGSGAGAPAVAAAQPVQKEPEKKVKPQEVFSKFMALPEDVKGQFFTRYYNTFVEAFKQTSIMSGQEEDKYSRAVESQITLTKWISRISPVSAYVYAVTDIADTGIEHEKYLKKSIWTYQSQFLDYITKKFNMPDSERTHGIFGGALREPPYTLDGLSKYQYKPMPIAERLKFALVDIAILFIFIVAFFLAAFFSFLRAEIID